MPDNPDNAVPPANVAPADSGRSDAEERMLRAAGEYLAEKGWKVLVISADRVELPNPRDPGHYDFVIRFTGTRR